MFSQLRKRLTWANVAMTLALVFAMSGGAYAAKKFIITNTKQISPKVLKQLEGKAGPAGAQGPAGPAGPQGPAGAAGKDGTNGAPGANGKDGANGQPGADGKSVVAEEEAKGAGPCKEGGSSFEVEGSGVKTYACNGEGAGVGGGGLPKTLGAGETETGAWDVQVPDIEGGGAIVGAVEGSISFPVQLKSALSAAHAIYVAPGDTSHEAECPGTSSKPAAKAGDLCLYATLQERLEPYPFGVAHDPSQQSAVEGAGTGISGAVLLFLPVGSEGGFVRGTWAVTGS